MLYLYTLFDNIDIFGTFIQLSIRKREKLSTSVGGIITLIIGVALIALFFLLGKDFLNKTNPRTSSSMYESLNFSMVNMSEKNLTVAIKIISSTSEEDIFNDVVYYDYFHLRKYYDEPLGKYLLLARGSLNESDYRCNESFIKKHNLPNGTYLCLFFFYDELFGGDTGNPEYSVYQMNLGRCAGLVPPAYSSHCYPKSFYTGSGALTIRYQAQIFYPTLLYNPNNYDNPIEILYKNEAPILDVNLPKIYKFYYSTTIFENDVGWMFENKKTETYWTIDDYSVQYFYNSDEYLEEPLSSSLLLTISIQMNKKIAFNKRSYLKLPEVLSSIFSVIKIIISVIQIIFLFGITPRIKEYTLINLLFDTKKSSKLPHSLNKKTSNNISNMGSSSLSYSNNYLIAQNKSPVTTNFLKSPNLSTTIGTPNTIKVKKQINEFEKLKLKEYMEFSFCCSFCKRNTNTKNKLLYKAKETVSNVYDYEYYTKMIYDLQILKKYTFKDDPYLGLLTNYYKKENIWNLQENKLYYELDSCSHNLVEELKNIKDSSNFENLVDSLKKNEDYLFNILRDDIKTTIMNISLCNKKE